MLAGLTQRTNYKGGCGAWYWGYMGTLTGFAKPLSQLSMQVDYPGSLASVVPSSGLLNLLSYSLLKPCKDSKGYPRPN